MPRILELFAKRGLTPTDWRSHCDGDRLAVEIRMAEMDPPLAGYIARCLRQIYPVQRVLVSRREPGSEGSRADIPRVPA